MATRSRIGYVYQRRFHCFCLSPLGWLSRMVGEHLKKHYNEDEKVRELIDGGDMSSCYTDSTWDLETGRNPNHHPVIIQSVARIAHLDTFKHCPI